MSIPFGCACGKKLHAKDEFAGKKMRCPGCGKVLTIPKPSDPATDPKPAPPRVTRTAPSAPPPTRRVTKASDPAPPPRVTRAPDPPPRPAAASNNQDPPPDVPAAAPSPPPGPALVNFPCSCGRRLKARQQDAGGEIDCPNCGRALLIPAQDTDEPPQPPSTAQANPWDDGFLSQSSTPWKDAATRRRGADGKEPRNEKAGSWRPALAALLLLAGGAAALWYFAPDISAAAAEQRRQFGARPVASNPYADLDRISGASFAVLTIRPSEVLGPNANPLLAKVWQENSGGLSPQDVERLTVVLFGSSSAEGTKAIGVNRLVIVRTKEPITRSRIIQRLIPSPMMLTTRIQQRYFISGGESKQRPRALYFFSPICFMVGERDTVRYFMRFPARPPVAGPLADALKAVREDRPLVLGLNEGAEWPAKGPAWPGPCTAAVVTVAKARGEVQARLRFDTAATAKNVAAKQRQSVQQLTMTIRQQQLSLAAWGAIRVEAPRVCRAIGSATLDPIAALATLHEVPGLPGLPPFQEELDLAGDLKQNESALRQMPQVQVQGAQVILTPGPNASELPPELWMPYLQEVLEATTIRLKPSKGKKA